MHKSKQPHNRMGFTGQSTDGAFVFRTEDHSLCEIQIRGKLLPELTTSISKHLSTYLVQYGVPGGLLIDVRYCANLSVVRLSALLDTISQPKMPLAVLLATEHDQYVASLLHHTLQHWRQIGFFVKPTTAFHFLTTMALNNYKPTDTNLH